MIIYTPGFFDWPLKWIEPEPFITSGGIMDTLIKIMTKDGHPFILDEGGEVKYNPPVLPGDVIAASTKLADIRERESQGSKMYIRVFENSFIMRNGVLLVGVG